MASLHYAFAPTIPAGTPIANPVTRALLTVDLLVRQIDIQVPPGPRGTVGIQLTTAGLQVWPVVTGTWFVTDNRTFTFIPPEDTPVSQWNLTGYNTGQYPHTIQIVFYADPLPSAGVGGDITYLDPSQLSQPASTVTDMLGATQNGG